MTFFADRPRRRVDEPEPQPAQPEWFGPPRGVLPGYDPQRAIVFYTDDAILVIGKFDAYPTGATFTVHLQLRGRTAEFEHMPWDLHMRGHFPGGHPDDLLRIGLIYADGSSWSNLDTREASIDTAPAAPFVIGRSGGGDVNSWSMEHWLWPLPPDGPLTLIAEWPRFEIGETRVELDATRIRSASTEAVHLWA